MNEVEEEELIIDLRMIKKLPLFHPFLAIFVRNVEL